MCRYAFSTYKPHLACFRCRKSFKRRLLEDVMPGGAAKPARCPDCGGDVADMGLDFKPPPRDRLHEWSLIEDLFAIGFTFHSCGCSGPGFRPRAPAEYKTFLSEILGEYERHRRGWERTPRTAGEAEKCREAIEHWNERIAAVRAALERAGA